MAIQVRCVSKADRDSAHERILGIGGINSDGSRWKLSQDRAVEGIEGGKWEFYVFANYQTVKVVVAVSRFGNKYLRTEADDEQPNNLLSLPECP